MCYKIKPGCHTGLRLSIPIVSTQKMHIMTIRKKTQRLFGLFLATVFGVAMLTGCCPYALVNSETYNGANLADYKTFRIVTPNDDNKLPPGMEMVTYYNIANAIRTEMAMRGFTEDPGSPMLINIGLTVQKEIATQPAYPAGYMGPWPWYGPYYNGYSPWFMYPRGYYWPGYYNPNAQVITGIYNEGVLTMDIINLPKKEALYSASVATIMDGSGRFRNIKGIQQAVDILFSKFPVPLLPQYRSK